MGSVGCARYRKTIWLFRSISPRRTTRRTRTRPWRTCERPASALAGLTEKHDELLLGLSIKTVRDLGSKYFALAGVLVAAAGKQG